MNILIPMAGRGSRFAEQGVTLPKPIIPVRGRPMIERVVENLGPAYDGHTIFVVLQEHAEKYPWYPEMLQRMAARSIAANLPKVTRGPAETCLAAKKWINTNQPLLIADCDQILEWSSYDFFLKMEEEKPDGCLLTWASSNPKSSYALLDADGFVIKTAEKEVISDQACCGLYYWRKGSDFVSCAEKVIARGETQKDEYFVAPLYNEFIGRGAKIITHHINHHWPIGTPEDLSTFLLEESLDKRIQ